MAKDVRLAYVYIEKQLKNRSDRGYNACSAVHSQARGVWMKWNRLIRMLPCCNIVLPKSESLLKAVPAVKWLYV